MLFCSTTFHLFNCSSPDSFACTARLDYSGIGIVILMSQWGMMVYAFYCWTIPFYIFTGILGFFSIVVVVGPMFRIFHHRRFRIVRALMYVVLSVVFPLVWWILCSVKYGVYSKLVVHIFYLGCALCYLGYAFGIFFYISRVPERIFPGKFDFAFGSHSIWHVGVIAGAALLLTSFVQVAHNIQDNSCSQLETFWYLPYNQ